MKDFKKKPAFSIKVRSKDKTHPKHRGINLEI
jgi:hypothetical protein